MKFKEILTGKSKEDKKKENAPADGATATQIAELEEHLNGRTDNLKQTEKRLKKLSGKVGDAENTEDIFARPHGPIGELSVEPEADLDITSITAGEDTDAVPEENAGEVKLVAVKAEAAPPPVQKEVKVEAIGDSLDKLFSSDDEEENPLASLIRSLPEVDVNELMDDLQEIKGIIKDWQKK